MNKKFIIFGVVLLIFLILIAILISSLTKKKDEEEPTNTGSTATERTTLLYYGLWEPTSVMQPLIDEYESLNKNIKIDYQQKSITQYDLNTYTRLVQGSSSNDPVPDIIKINGTWLPKYQQYLSPMPQSAMTAEDYSNTFFPVAKEAFIGVDNQIYAMPLSIDGLVLFYNKKLLAQEGITAPPKDWNSFLETAKKLTKKDTNGRITQAGVGMGSAKNVKHSADILNLLFFQNGAQILSSDRKTVQLTGTKAESAIKYYTDYIKVHKVWSDDFGYDLDEFYAGKVAMFFGPSWRAFDIINASPQLEFGIAPVPQLTNNQSVNYAMFWGDAVPSKSQNQAEAWKFLKFLSEKQQMQDFYANGAKIRAFGQPYSRLDIASELKTNPYLTALIDSAPTMRIWQMGDQAYVESELRSAITSIVDSGKTPSSALEKASSNINAKYQPYFE